MVATKPEPFVDSVKAPPLWKQFLAFFVGLLSLFFGYYLDETFGGLAACAGMGAAALTTQFFLSRGNPCSFLECWPLVAAMNCPLIGVCFVAGEAPLLVLLAITLLSSFVGVALASMAAAGHGKRHRRSGVR